MSGSGEDIKTGLVAPEQPSGFEQFMTNPAFQKYITNMGIGMQGGRNLSESLSGGFARAGQGYLQDLEEQKRKKIVKDILGDGSLEKLTGSDAYQKGLELIASGDASLQAIGQHLVTTAMSKAPSSEWTTSTQTINGRQIPVQINTKTGEIKPYSADIINGPKATYVPELQQFVDPYGNPVQPSGQQAPTAPSAPISGFTDTGIANLTPRQKSENAMKIAEEERAAKRKIEEEQRAQGAIPEKIKGEAQGKLFNEAETYMAEDNQKLQAAASEKSKSLLNDLGTQIKAAHDIPLVPKSLENIPYVQEQARKLGWSPATDLAATVKNLVVTKLGQMRSAGVVTAGQLNTDKDTELMVGSIFDVNAPLETQMKQLERLTEDVKTADEAIKLKQQRYKSVLEGTYTPLNQTPKNTEKVEPNPNAGKILNLNGKRYKVNADNSVTEIQ